MTRTPQAKTALPKPVIVSPPDGAIIRLGYGAERLPLKSEGTVGDVYWYVDDAFLTKSSVGTTPVIALTIGSHRVSLLDARGLTSKSEFKVLAPKSESAGVLTVKR
jgi:membrane carboxypeptidase/penicillin-binding protein PbpC